MPDKFKIKIIIKKYKITNPFNPSIKLVPFINTRKQKAIKNILK